MKEKLGCFKAVSSAEWDSIVSSIESDPVGMYLVRTTKDNGQWIVVWSRTYREDAYAFSKPGQGVNIPQYKFSGRPEVLSSGINVNIIFLKQK